MTTATLIRLPVGTWTLDKNHTHIGFVARHMMVTKVRGSFGEFNGSVEFDGDPSNAKVEVAISTASVHTGVPDRDDHLRSPDFLDVDNYPEMTFVSTGIEPVGDGWQLTGDLTIKDVRRPVTLDVAFEGSDVNPFGKTVAAFTAETEIEREDWGLIWNVVLESGGMLVSKKVKIEIEAQLVQI